MAKRRVSMVNKPTQIKCNYKNYGINRKKEEKRKKRTEKRWDK